MLVSALVKMIKEIKSLLFIGDFDAHFRVLLNSYTVFLFIKILYVLVYIKILYILIYK